MWEIILALIIGIPGGIFVGFKIADRRMKIEEEMLISKAEDVMEGKIKNDYSYEGQEYPANTFIMRNENEKEQKIKFKVPA